MIKATCTSVVAHHVIKLILICLVKGTEIRYYSEMWITMVFQHVKRSWSGEWCNIQVEEATSAILVVESIAGPRASHATSGWSVVKKHNSSARTALTVPSRRSTCLHIFDANTPQKFLLMYLLSCESYHLSVNFSTDNVIWMKMSVPQL